MSRSIIAGLLIGFAVLMILLVITGVLKAQDFPETWRSSYALMLQNEHRFTALETSMATMTKDVSDLKVYVWTVLGGFATLLIKEGYGLLKPRQSDE